MFCNLSDKTAMKTKHYTIRKQNTTLHPLNLFLGQPTWGCLPTKLKFEIFISAQ